MSSLKNIFIGGSVENGMCVDAIDPSLLDYDVQRLQNIGFRKCGEWRLDEKDRLKCPLENQANAKNVLYAFISAGTVRYIGKTVCSLKVRMCGYQNPAPTQSTNIKGNRLIREALRLGESVEIHALPDNGLLHYGGFHVNLAAGLEDNLIKTLKPEWNGAEKERKTSPDPTASTCR